MPIPGAKNAEQAIHNAGALTFSLSDSEMDVLNQASLKFNFAKEADKYSSIDI